MTWRRFDPLAGVGAVVLWVVGTFLLENTDRPEGKDSAAFAAWVRDNDAEIITGTVIFGFGVLFFLWFLGALRTRLLDGESGGGHLTTVAFAGGVATAVMMMATYLPWAKAAFDNENMTDSAVEAVVQMGDSFFGGVELFAIVLLVGTGVVVRRTGALPRWLGWFSFALALVLAIIPIGWAGVLFGLPLWTLVMAIILYRIGGANPAATPHGTSPAAN
jgi:hypothetical protein